MIIQIKNRQMILKIWRKDSIVVIAMKLIIIQCSTIDIWSTIMKKLSVENMPIPWPKWSGKPKNFIQIQFWPLAWGMYYILHCVSMWLFKIECYFFLNKYPVLALLHLECHESIQYIQIILTSGYKYQIKIHTYFIMCKVAVYCHPAPANYAPA